ncbi:MAG: copper homeostasis protein CutC [Spirochaetales bacterium]|nr:copper homeostasis protein CutC [Spirochaetales bacterium]
MNKQPLIEICLDSVESAIEAEKGGADRVELCDNLFEGGTTPSLGTIKMTRQEISIGLNVLIRPRGGDFCYSDLECEVMKADIIACRENGVDGVVIGILDPEGRVDVKRTAALIEVARPMSVTFHRAFDMAKKPFEALEKIIGLGCDRILTSGAENTVLEGLDTLGELVKKAGDRIIIMPGNGITERNFPKVIERTGAREYHIYIHSEVEGQMKYRPDYVYMGGALRQPEFFNRYTDSNRLISLRNRV